MQQQLQLHHAAAAFVKYSRLPRRNASPRLLQKLAGKWLQNVQAATTWECANVLWVHARLGVKEGVAWGPTLEKFASLLRALDVDETGSQKLPQQLSNVVWACATLRKHASVDNIQLLLRTLVHPVVLANTNSQNIANNCWSLSVLQEMAVWGAVVNQQLLGKLLAKEQLQMLSASGAPQEVTQVVVAMLVWPQPMLFRTALLRSVWVISLQTHIGCWGPQKSSQSPIHCGHLRIWGW